MKKLIALLTAAILILAGCSDSSSGSADLPESRYEVNPDAPMYTANVDQGATIDWFMEIDWYEGEWGRDVVTQTMQTQTGVTVNIMKGTADDLNNLIAAGDAPDLITMDSNNPLNDTPEEFAYSLDDLSAAYSPYFMSDLADPTIMDWYRQEDGKTYGYPSHVITPTDVETYGVGGASAFYVRGDIYEEVGSPDMSTPEGFHQAVADMVAAQPTDDNGAPMTGLCFLPAVESWTKTMFDFLSLPRFNEDLSPYDGYTDPEYITWLTTFNEMYTEGLISADNFTMTQEDMNIKIKSGGCTAYMSMNVNNDNSHMLEYSKSHPEQAYINVDGPKDSEGNPHTLAAGSMNGWLVTYVSKDSDDPQTAFYMMEYLRTPEGIKTVVAGEEGVHYTDNGDGTITLTDEYYAAKDQPDSFKTFGINYFYPLSQESTDQAKLGILEYTPAQLWQQSYLDPSSVYLTDIDPEEGTQEARDYASFVEQRTQIFTQAIVGGEGAVDVALAEYEALKETYNYDAILAIQAENVAANIEQLGDTWLPEEFK